MGCRGRNRHGAGAHCWLPPGQEVPPAPTWCAKAAGPRAVIVDVQVDAPNLLAVQDNGVQLTTMLGQLSAARLVAQLRPTMVTLAPPAPTLAEALLPGWPNWTAAVAAVAPAAATTPGGASLAGMLGGLAELARPTGPGTAANCPAAVAALTPEEPPEPEPPARVEAAGSVSIGLIVVIAVVLAAAVGALVRRWWSKRARTKRRARRVAPKVRRAPRSDGPHVSGRVRRPCGRRGSTGGRAGRTCALRVFVRGAGRRGCG